MKNEIKIVLCCHFIINQYFYKDKKKKRQLVGAIFFPFRTFFCGTDLTRYLIVFIDMYNSYIVHTYSSIKHCIFFGFGRNLNP